MYETIVLGATFLAAGIAIRQKKKCLILEQSFQAGSEFFGALNYGTDYDAPLKTREGAQLLQQFFGEGVTPYMRNIFIYPILQQSNVLFGTQVVSVEKREEGYRCEVYGMDGFSVLWAKNVIDTRCSEEISCQKTYNLLMESDTQPYLAGIDAENIIPGGHYVLRCPVPLTWDYAQARALGEERVRQFSQGQRLILWADEFDYQVKENLPESKDGIAILPSKAYKNPVCAFEAGLLAKGV